VIALFGLIAALAAASSLPATEVPASPRRPTAPTRLPILAGTTVDLPSTDDVFHHHERRRESGKR
jgi:hypothetical protein